MTDELNEQTILLYQKYMMKSLFDTAFEEVYSLLANSSSLGQRVSVLLAENKWNGEALNSFLASVSFVSKHHKNAYVVAALEHMRPSFDPNDLLMMLEGLEEESLSYRQAEGRITKSGGQHTIFYKKTSTNTYRFDCFTASDFWLEVDGTTTRGRWGSRQLMECVYNLPMLFDAMQGRTHRPSFCKSTRGNVMRIDDRNNPDMWLEFKI